MFLPCRICGLNDASCKAHIVPKQFFRRLRDDAPHLLQFDLRGRMKQSYSQSGIREQGIVCSDCDRRMGTYDEYAYTVLTDEVVPAKFRYPANGQAAAPTDRRKLSIYEIGQVDVARFKLFLISLAWRAAASSHPYFNGVKLGPYMEEFLSIFQQKNPIAPDSIDVVLILFCPDNFDRVMFPPTRDRYNGVNVIQFYTYPWKLLLKIDKRKFNYPLKPLVLEPNKVCYAIVQDFLTLGEKAALRILKQQTQSK